MTKPPSNATNQQSASKRLHATGPTRGTGPERERLEPKDDVMSIGFSAKVEADLAEWTSRNAS